MDYPHVLPYGFRHHFYAWALYEIASERDQLRRLMKRIDIGNFVGHVDACLPLTDEQLAGGLKCLSVSYEELMARAQRLHDSGDLPRLRKSPKGIEDPPPLKKVRPLPGSRLYTPRHQRQRRKLRMFTHWLFS